MQFPARMGFHAHQASLDLGLLPGTRNYTRFIILGQARTGSNFLRGLLNSHNQIITFGELFRFYDNIGWELPPYDPCWQTRRTISLMQADPVRFLNRYVFKKLPGHIAAVGFKLFYYHARQDARSVLWSHVQAEPTLRILHLKRTNTLRLLVSLKRAHMTDNWTNVTGAVDEDRAVTLDYNECLEQFEGVEAARKDHDLRFKDHPKLDVSYEDLSGSTASQTRRVLEFLGVAAQPLTPSTYKQARKPLREVVTNYTALKRRFEDTRWAAFFDE